MSKFIVICVAKDEPFIDEFVEYYISMGFDEVIIGNNGLNDTQLRSIQDYIESSKVKLVDLIGRSKPFQVEFYKEICSTFNDEDWICKVDCDELIDLNGVPLREFVSRFPENCGSICFNWMMYSNQRLNTKSFYDALPVLDTNDNHYIKQFIRYSTKLIHVGEHECMWSDDNILHYHCNGNSLRKLEVGESSFEWVDYRYGHCKHFYFQSGTRWLDKISRGFPNDPNSCRDLKDGLDRSQYIKTPASELLGNLMRLNLEPSYVIDRLKSLPEVTDGYLDTLIAMCSDRTDILCRIVGPEFNQLKRISIIEGKNLIYVP